jgi:DNA-binding LacI/PurR family transcriptional regulator
VTRPSEKPQRRPRVTGADVALRAGVSAATVSYVLNEDPRHTIPAETRERVRLAAAELGYRINPHGRALRRGRSNLVLLLVPDLPGSHTWEVFVSHATAEVSRIGYSLVTWTSGQGEDLDAVLANLTPAAVMALLTPSPAEDEALLAAGIPCVTATLAEGTIPRAELVAGSLQVQHLAAYGHRRIGYVTTSDPRLEPFSRSRLEGARRSVLDLGLEPLLVTSAPDSSRTSVDAISDTLRHWAASGITAACCYNDAYAAMVMAAARRAGLSLPDDLSLVGVDDDEVSAYLNPALSSVALGVTGIVDHMVARLQHQLHGGKAPGPLSSQQITIVERESVRQPSGAALEE